MRFHNVFLSHGVCTNKPIKYNKKKKYKSIKSRIFIWIYSETSNSEEKKSILTLAIKSTPFLIPFPCIWYFYIGKKKKRTIPWKYKYVKLGWLHLQSFTPTGPQVLKITTLLKWELVNLQIMTSRVCNLVRVFLMGCLKFKPNFGFRNYFFYFASSLFKTRPTNYLFWTLFYYNIIFLLILYYIIQNFQTYNLIKGEWEKERTN